MTPRTLIVVALALVSGLAAAVGVGQLRKPPAVIEIKPEVVLLPVVAKDLMRGDTISEEYLSEVEWPKDLVPAGALRVKEEILAKVAQQKMVAGEVFLLGKIGETAKFSGKIAEGMRGFTIMTPNDSSFVAGMIEPGDVVDVLFTNSKVDNEATGGATSAPLLQGIEVLAIGNVIEPDRSKNESRQMRSVTLAVPLEKATMLALGAESGTLNLVLRNERDLLTDDVGGYSLRELQQLALPVALRPKPAAEVEEQIATPDPAMMQRIEELELALRQQAEATAEEELRRAADAAETVANAQRTLPIMVVRTIRGFVPGAVVMKIPKTTTTGALFAGEAEPVETTVE